jgi:hypothetical protein
VRAADPGACLTEQSVVELVAGRLTGASLESARRHLDACDECRTLVAEVYKYEAEPRDSRLSATAAPTRVEVPRPHPVAGDAAPRALERTRLGRYAIEELLGEGGMGRVYRARDTQLGRPVALKLVRGGDPEHSGQLATRLMREAQAMARLSHPNVVNVYDAGTLEGQLFVAMELVPGATLAVWVREPRPWREILARFIEAGRGLAAAHEAGIVHRDFKPANVFLGSDGRVRVGDFGLARLHEELESTSRPAPAARDIAATSQAETNLTQTGVAIGTPAYMAPEQFRGATADARTDQFSFCVALYRALYGVHAFAAAGLADLAGAVTAGKVQPPPAGTAVPPRLFRVLRRGLSVAPDDRYASMAVLLMELERVPRRTWSRRTQIAAGAGVGLVIAAAVAAGGALWRRPPTFAPRAIVATVSPADASPAPATEPRAGDRTIAAPTAPTAATVSAGAAPRVVRPTRTTRPKRVRPRTPPAPLGQGKDGLKDFGD